MRAYFLVVPGLLCFGVTFSELTTYKAGVVDFLKDDHQMGVGEIIKEAGKMNVDILMLPFPQKIVHEHYDEMIKTVSKAANQASIYVAAQLPNRVRCNNQYEDFQNTVLFGKDGSLVSVFRKPMNPSNSCNSTTDDPISFTTNFGTTFSVISTEDLVLKNPVALANDVKNFIVAGQWVAELPFLTSNQFLPAWVDIAGANLLIGPGAYTGKEVKTVLLDGVTKITVAELEKQPKLGQIPHLSHFTQTKPQLEDMSQYTIIPLDLKAAARGYKETVCDGQFCCQFYVKTSDAGYKQGASNFSLAVFEGVRSFGSSHSISVQNCAIVACAGFYKRSCAVGSNNATSDVTFKEVTVSANFSKDSVQFPTALNSAMLHLSSNEYNFDSRIVNGNRQVTVKLESSGKLLTFGIFGRDYTKNLDNDRNSNNVDETVLSEDLNELFDYLWIRLRILIFVISIYFLEMM